MQIKIDEENLELNFTEPAAPKRKPRVIKSKVITPAMRMLEAVNFIMPAQKKTGRIENRFCRIVNDWVVASTFDLMIAHPIEGVVDSCPNSFMLRSSLMDCGEDINVTALSDDSISIMSGDLKTVIPCVSAEQIYLYDPDPKIGDAADTLKNAIAAIYGIVSIKKQQKDFYSKVLIQDQTCVSTHEGKIILQSFHGCHLPDDIVISKEAAQAVAKSKIQLTGFGFSKNSFTFYFENGAFIRAARYDCLFPNVGRFVNSTSKEIWQVPDNFFKALKTITPFSKDGFVHFKEGLITSDTEENEASTFNMEMPFTSISVNIKTLTLLKTLFDNVQCDGEKLIFTKDLVKGAISVSDTKEIESENE